jgi:DNA modification methylase
VDLNTLYFGDNLYILRDHFPDESVDLIYLDPPFNSQRGYNLLFKTPKGLQSDAQITAFEDTWHWGEQAEREYNELTRQSNTDVSELIISLRRFLKESDMMAYLVMMTNRLLEMHRILKQTGSIYLHCDPTASHYLKIVMDAIFGFENYRSEITWLRSRNPKGSQFESKQYSPDTDIILFYARSDETPLHYDRIKIPLSEEELKLKYDRKDDVGPFTDGPILRSPSMGDRPNLVYEYKGYTPGPYGWRVNLERLIEIDRQGNLGWSATGKPYRKLRPEEDTGSPIGSCWTDISSINPQADERLGYPTQKPIALLERVILASSNPGEIVLDPFCGCGTAVHASQRLGRSWIGIDITHLAIQAIERRMQKAFPGLEFETHGVPKDLDAARDLAMRDKYEFQLWACSLVSAQPYKGGKKGADTGIDGILYFEDDKHTTKKAIVSVKGGEHVGRSMIADLKNSVDREGAQMGFFVTLTEPTGPMKNEALTGGYFQSKVMGEFPKIQILTIEELLAGKRPQYPDLSRGQSTYKQARTEKKISEQPKLFDS